MANNATLTFSLPEDTDSNYLQLWSATTENGSYSQVGTDIAYAYGETTYEFEDISITTWYKIRFYNSVDDQYGPYSEAVYGGSWTTNTSPFLAVSTTTDGANYATIEDVRTFSGLLYEDLVPNDRVSQSLRRSRAIIDIKTSDMGLSRFANFPAGDQRRKYNASLRIVKEAEINYALGMIYRGLTDDIITQGLIDNSPPKSITIGKTNIQLDSDARNSNSYKHIERLSLMYTNRATVLLSLLQPSSIDISYRDNNSRRSPAFNWPQSIRGQY